jgi:type IV pilus assembly protein PilQ
MKILLRLALLSFSAAGGILAAVQLAGGTTALETSVEASAVATTHSPTATNGAASADHAAVAKSPAADNARATRSSATTSAKPAAPAIVADHGPAHGPDRDRSLSEADDLPPAPAAVQFEPLRPRVAAQFPALPGLTAGPPSAEAITAAERLLQAAGKLPAGGLGPAGLGQAGGDLNVLTPIVMKLLEQQAQTNQLMQSVQLQQIQNGGPRLPAAAGSPAPGAIAPAGPLPAPPVETVPVPATIAAPETAPAPVAVPVPAAAAESRPAAVVAGEGDDKLIINSRDADVRELLEQLGAQAGMNILASKSVQGTISVNLQNVGVDEALDAILKAGGFVSRRDGAFTYIGTLEDFAALERAQDRIGTRVYRPNYINAKELANLLTPLVTPSVGKVSVTSPAAVGIAVDNTAAGGDAISQQDALVVQDYENVLAELDQVVKDLDRRPLQVSIESMIVSVTLNDENSYGVDFQLLRDKDHIRFGFGSPANALNNTFQGGFKFAFLDESLAVFLSALEKVGDTNVVASPKILCLNKQKAEILIGQRLGYISTTVTQNFSTQNVEFLDVGAQLRLRPYISSDGLIRLEVHPELSEGEVVVNGGFTLPRKTLTEVTTNVMCPDGCTVILGGLMRENLRSDSTQTPYLGSLPMVGALFRTKTEKIERTEILVLLTPRIIYDGDLDAEGKLYTDDTLAMENAKYHRMSPIAKAHLGRDHADKALVAMRNGNRMAAERHARLAVHYDPLNRDAVRLLHQIGRGAGGVPVSQGLGVETVVGDVGDVGVGQPGVPLIMPDGELPPWALDDLQQGDIPAAPLHPRDPGIPGQSFDVARPEVFHVPPKK